jgi:hypothetical protein
MRYILLYIVLLGIFSTLSASEKIYYCENSQYYMENDAYTDGYIKYYLVNELIAKKYSLNIIRRISKNEVIVKIKETKNNIDFITYKYINNNWKISSSILNKKIKSNQKMLFSIKYEDGYSFSELYNNNKYVNSIRELPSANIQIVSTTLKYIMEVLIHVNKIEYVDVVNRSPVEESPIRQFLPELSRINLAKQNYPYLHGEELVISIKENSINESSDIDLFGKVTLDDNSSLEFTQHAKEMGTLIAGSGNSYKTGEGIVSAAKLICTDFSSLFAEDAAYYDKHQISVQNHSYGTGIENYYGTESISYDQIVVDYPQLMHVFSAGNSGTSTPETGNYAGLPNYATITGNYKQAKNVLVVAALDSSMNHMSLTSSGPAYDGRIKPELAAFGAEGTSESAAIASGSVVMIQNHYSNSNKSLPNSSLVKSIMIATTNEAHTKGIDFRTGYGSINLNRSLQLLDSGWYQESSIAVNETNTIQINIPENSSEFKLVMSWVDPPANPEDVISLVNDLDITIKDTNGTIWQPWILDSTPNITALSSLPTRGEDHLNNTEMISIENPVAGTHTISVISNELKNQNQLYSIAYFIKEKEHFQWSYPLASDKLEAGTNTFLRWENTYSSQTVNVSIQYGDGNWDILGIADVSEEQYKLIIKDTTVLAKVKVDIGIESYISDQFSVSSLLTLNIENDCVDDFTISWDKLDNTEEYNIYELQNDQLISILNTSDTIVNFDKSIFTGNYYAVSPNHSGTEGLRSFSVNYENRNQGCYITNFLAFLDIEDFINVELSINVPFEIEQISIWRLSNGTSEIFKQFSTANEVSFAFEDHNLKPGLYTYYAELLLNDGRRLFSNEHSLFYTDKSTVVAFPNPVINDDFVNILNDYPGGYLLLIDEKGVFVKTFELVNTVEEINIFGLKKGLYVYKIVFDSKVVHSGRISRL